jgi:nitrite reductase/ring-hydroxylating ferredoxin subunit
MAWHQTDLPADPPNAPTLTPITVAGRALVLTSVDGEWYAFEDRCSHAGCAFSEDGAIEGDRLICDCHGSEFDIRSGAAMAPPAVDPIASPRVRIVDGMVEIDL